MIRTEFTNRIAAQIGVDATRFKASIDQQPKAVRETPTESYEAVELGFEKALKFVASAKPGPDLEAAGKAMEQENPKAFSAVGDLLIRTGIDVGERLGVSDFVSFGDGVSATQLHGNSFNGTLWIDTTPGQPGIESMILSNDKTRGPNPCIAPPAPREGEVTSDSKVDAALLNNVSPELGADKLFRGLDDEKLTRFTDWAFGRTDLPIGRPLDGLPEGWAEVPNGDRNHVGEGDNYILGNPFGTRQILAVDSAKQEVTLVTDREYRRQGDFEGSADVLKLHRYADGEIRRDYHEMHD